VYAFAGPAVLAVIALWIAYLVPHKLRHRQQMLESRTDDRYSAALRVLAVSGPVGSRRRLRSDNAVRGIRPDCGSPQKRTALLHRGTGARIGNEGRDMDRPHTTAEGMGADAARKVAQLKAAHAAATARRGAAARRRGVLATALSALTVVAWVVGAVTAVPLLVALVPTVVLGSVLVLGRRAVVQGEAAEIEWQRRIEEAATPVVRAPRPGRVGASGRAVRASVDATQAMPRVNDRKTADPTAKKVTDADADATWSPVDVPRPTYTTKPRAPRREPAPLGEVEGSTAVRPARTVAQPAAETTAGPAAQPAAETTAAPAAETAAAPAETAARRVDGAADPAVPAAATATVQDEPTGSIDLNAVLARRRAAGE